MSTDVLKSHKQILSEQPLLVTAVASLCGVSTMLVHSWSTPVNAQNRFLRLLFEKFTTTTSAATTASNEIVDRSILHAIATANYSLTTPYSSTTKAINTHSNRVNSTLLRQSIQRTESEESVHTDPHTDQHIGSVDTAPLPTATTVDTTTTPTTTTTAAGVYPIKRWIRLSRLVYGLPHTIYSDA